MRVSPRNCRNQSLRCKGRSPSGEDREVVSLALLYIERWLTAPMLQEDGATTNEHAAHRKVAL